MFNFPINLPDFYKPDRELLDTLKAIVNSLKDTEQPTPESKKDKEKKWKAKGKKVKEVSVLLKSGMKHQPNQNSGAIGS